MKVSFDKVASWILTTILERGEIHYLDVAAEFGIGTSTASVYCRRLAKMYPDKLWYYRGLLVLTGEFTEDEMPTELKYKKMIKDLQTALKRKKMIARKLRENHLTHIKEALLMRDLKKLEKYIDKLREKLDEIEKE